MKLVVRMHMFIGLFTTQYITAIIRVYLYNATVYLQRLFTITYSLYCYLCVGIYKNRNVFMTIGKGCNTIVQYVSFIVESI